MKYLNKFHQETTEKAIKAQQSQPPAASLEHILKIMKETSKGTRFIQKKKDEENHKLSR